MQFADARATTTWSRPRRRSAAQSYGAMAGQYLSFAVRFAASVVISCWFLAPDQLGLFSIALAAALLVAILRDFAESHRLAGRRVLLTLSKDDDLRWIVDWIRYHVMIRRAGRCCCKTTAPPGTLQPNFMHERSAR